MDTPGGAAQVDWSFSGSGTGFLSIIELTVSLYADPVAPASNVLVGTVSVIGAEPSYTEVIPIAPNSLAPGAYRLTTLITTVVAPTGASLPIAGFVDGPIIHVRPGR